jgi:hypothetical protein
LVISVFFLIFATQNKTIKKEIKIMDYEVKLKVAPIFNHFYETNNVRCHEERLYTSACTKRTRDIINGYKRGKKAVLKYIEESGKPLDAITKEELMNVFENASK